MWEILNAEFRGVWRILNTEFRGVFHGGARSFFSGLLINGLWGINILCGLRFSYCVVGVLL